MLALVERHGDVRSFPMSRVTGELLDAVIKGHVHPDAKLITDEFPSYRKLGQSFSAHETVRHSAGEYVRGSVHTNTVENVFSLLKRGLIGVYHHVGVRHLHRYCAEFDFRYNRRYVDDGTRTALAIRQAEGRRLTYRPLANKGGLINKNIRGLVV